MTSLAYITLGPLQLNRNIRLRNVLGQSQIAYQHSRTIDGLARHYPFRVQAGQQLELDGEGGRFEIGQIRQVEALIAAAQPVYLQHHVHTGMVLITSINIDGLIIDYADYNDTHRVSAKITLITV